MKIISWNVNGIRSNILDFTKAANKKPRKLDSKSALAFLLKKYNPDIICFQETRLGENNYTLFSDESVTSIFPYQYWSSAKKTGARSGNRYSGTSIWSKTEPDKIAYEIAGLDNLEGRFIQVEYGDTVLITTYTPNAGSNWDYRLDKWEPSINKHLNKLIKSGKNIIYCSDFNIATKSDVWFGDLLERRYNEEYTKDENSSDTKKLKRLVKSKDKYHTGKVILAGYSPEERAAYNKLLKKNSLIDCYKYKNPSSIDNFTWFNIRVPKSITQNKGWLIDRFLIRKCDEKAINKCAIDHELGIYYRDTFISDHKPIFLDIKL